MIMQDTIDKYKANAIKAIYWEDPDDNTNISTNEIYDYYVNDILSENAIEVPDRITNQENVHQLSKNHAHDDDYSSLVGDVITSLVSTKEEHDKHSSYYKILDSRDIDWDNALLKYSEEYNENSNELNGGKKPRLVDPIQYKKLTIDEINSKIVIENDTTSDYVLDHGIYKRINSTHELLAIIDYLLLRVKALYFELDKVKIQHQVKNVFDSN